MKTTAVMSITDTEPKITPGYEAFDKCFSAEYATTEIQEEISNEVYNADTGMWTICRSSISMFYYLNGEFVGFATHSDVVQVEGPPSQDIFNALVSF